MPAVVPGGVILSLRFIRFSLLAVAFAVVGCAPDYSPNVYSGVAVQQANKVERGVVIGYRQVEIRADGTVGAIAGGAAGGVLGGTAGDDSITHALGAVGGALVGSLVGTTVEHTTGDTTGWEYIVRENKGDLFSVTQRQEKPLSVGQSVLVIMGKQARIVPDYTTVSAPPPTPTPAPVTNKSGSTAVVPATAAASAPIPIAPASASIAAAPPPVPAAAFIAPASSTAPAATSPTEATDDTAAPKPAKQ